MPPSSAAASSLGRRALPGGSPPSATPSSIPPPQASSSPTRTVTQPRTLSSQEENARTAKQVRSLGAMLGGQQQAANDQTGGGEDDGYEQREEQAYEPENQPSPLDAMYQGFSPYASAANDNDQDEDALSAADAIKKRNSEFQKRTMQAQNVQNQFISENAPTPDGRHERGNQPQQQPGELTVRNVPAGTDYNTIRTAERIKALQAQASLPGKGGDPTKALQTAVLGETGSEAMEMFHRGRRVMTFFTGAGSPLALIEQNVVVANRLFLNGRIQLPFFGGRPEGAYERNPSLRKLDRLDLLLAVVMDVSAIGVLLMSLVSMLITILPYALVALGAAFAIEQLGVNGAELLTQLAN